MDKNRRNDKIYVTPNNAYLYIAVLPFCLILVFSLQAKGSLFILSSIFIPFLLLPVYVRFKCKLIAGPGGIVIHRLGRSTVRIRYNQITKIKVSFFWNHTSLDLFRKQEHIGHCCSRDTNFDKLLSLLTEVMPDRINYTGPHL